jgi:hypothetical protein
MPRATFAGVTFDLLLSGLEDRHEGFTSVRDIPASGSGPARAYVDLGGPQLQRRTVQLHVDSEADYLTLAGLVGTPSAAGTLTSPAEGSPRDAVLVSISRTWRKGTGPQLCRSEWVFTT